MLILWKKLLIHAGVAILVVASVFVFTTAAIAHPHVWVKVRSELVFNSIGEITGVRHAWRFDQVYSAFALQGVGKDGVPVEKALQALAKINVKQLSGHNFFTFLRAGGADQKFSGSQNPNITLDDKKIMTLHFVALLEKPLRAKPAAVLRVFDPSYFVAFDFVPKEPVRLALAPKGCSVSIMRPRALGAAQKKRLEAVQSTNESPGASFGVFLAASAITACP